MTRARKLPYDDLRDTKGVLDIETCAQELESIAVDLLAWKRIVKRWRAALKYECRREFDLAVRKHGEERVVRAGSRLHALASRLGDAEECLHGFGTDFATDASKLRKAARFLTPKRRRATRRAKASAR